MGDAVLAFRGPVKNGRRPFTQQVPSIARLLGKELFMLRRLVAVLAIAMLPTLAMAQPEAGRWELTLNGTGFSDNDFVNNDFALTASVGYFLTKEFEVLFRQSVTRSDVPRDSADWGASSAFAIDYHFDLGRWQPFIGWQLGYLYGDSVRDTWFTGPEVGLKYFVHPQAFIYGMVQYDIFFRSGDDLEDRWDDGRWVYSLGIGVQF